MNCKINFSELYIILLLASLYPISILPFFLNDISVKAVLYPYRIVLVVFSILIIINSRQKPYSSFFKLLAVFFALYLSRMGVVFFIKKIQYDRMPIEYFASFIGASVLPSLSVFFIDFRKVKFQKIFTILYCIFLYFVP